MYNFVFFLRYIMFISVYILFLISTTAKDRMTNEEKRALDRANNYIYQEVRQAAEAHRQVLQTFLISLAENSLFCI